MRQKLLQRVGFLGIMMLATGVILSGCIEEPNPPVLDRVTSEVRFVHAVPEGPPVDIWVDDEIAAANVNYKSASAYLTVKSGDRFLRLVPAGADTVESVFRRRVSVRSYTKITMAFHGSMEDVTLLSTQERFTYADETSMLEDSVDVKLINLANTGTRYKLQRLVEEPNNYEDIIPLVQALSLSPYIRLVAETNRFAAATEANSRVVEFDHEFRTPGYRYTFIVVGNTGALDVLRLQDEPVN
ncbi:MAG: DUF4397 domain-containing protein [Bacteroidetes bacterium]|nr:DUF4397 domain-containing protein [Bacteroidota bacterium]